MELSVFTTSPINIHAADAEALTLSVENSISSFSFDETASASKLKEVSIPSTSRIKKVPTYAFDGCTQLTSFSVPAMKLDDIGIGAFNNCFSLTQVTFDRSTSAQVISDSTFAGCKALAEKDWSCVKYIGANAFEGCSSLVSVHLDAPIVTTICLSAFKDCTSLKALTIANGNGDSCTSANSNAFEGCDSLQTVLVKDSLYKKYIAADTWKDVSAVVSSYTQPTVTFLSGSTYDTKVKEQKVNFSADALPPTLAREDYEVTSWVGDYTNVTSDTSCYAQWKRTAAYFTYDTNYRVKYKYPIYNTPYVPASGIKEWKTDEVYKYIFVKDSPCRVTWNAGWHVVEGEVTIDGGAVCNGAVKLLLTDGCKLTILNVADINAGIGVTGDGNSLAIYGQALGTGALVTRGGRLGAGIGGDGNDGDGHDITINGGTVTAMGSYDGAAGIGGGHSGSGSNITINGGTVTATGEIDAVIGGAGIGGGSYGNGSNITINGGIVVADAYNIYGYYGEGIGGGYDGSGSDIKVSASLIVKADNNYPPETKIEHDTGEDIASKLAGKQYATVTPA